MAERTVLSVDEQVGRMLLDGGFIDDKQLKQALDKTKQGGKRLKEVLAEQGIVSAETYNTLLSSHLRIPIIDLQNIKIDPEAVRLIPENIAREQEVLALSIDGESLRVAIEDPQNIELLNTIATISGKRIKPVLPLRGGIKDMISAHYKLAPRIAQEMSSLIAEETPATARRQAEPLITADSVAQTPVVRALDMIISQAVKERASDIHIEPMEETLRIRYRIDGVLHEAASLPKGTHSALISRVKVISGMDIAERRRPQDGQFSMKVDNRDIDFRVASIESSTGERMTIRVLDKTHSLVPLPQLGFQPGPLQLFEGMLSSPYGMILVSGPTGSGKTTTNYSAIATLDAGEDNIMTIEDPVEYRFKGINQIQVNTQAGITFAAGLRSLMRQDPDIILVGEIRDKETADVAVNAALTGHLVLTTIHANDAAGAIIRLIDLGVEPFLVTSAVIGAISQRLVRKVCPYCKTITRVSAAEAVAYQNEMGEVRGDFLVGRGCNMCARSGYMGRVGVYEVLGVTDPIRQLIMKNAIGQEIRAEAIRSGMMSMRRDGMTKARDGITTPSEVISSVFTIL